MATLRVLLITNQTCLQQLSWFLQVARIDFWLDKIMRKEFNIAQFSTIQGEFVLAFFLNTFLLLLCLDRFAVVRVIAL